MKSLRFLLLSTFVACLLLPALGDPVRKLASRAKQVHGRTSGFYQNPVSPCLTWLCAWCSPWYAARSMPSLSEAADPRASAFSDLAGKRKAELREHLWSPEAGFFLDRIAGEEGYSDVITPMGFALLR